MSTALDPGRRSKLRILFLGTESLFSQRAVEQLLPGDCQLCGLLIAGQAPSLGTTRPVFPELPVARPPSVERLAEVHEIPIYHAVTLRDSEAISWWHALAPDVVVSAAFPFIVPSPLLHAPKFGGLNVHPSLLPAYRGPSPLFWQCRDGLSETGVTVHMLSERVDAGDIVAQTRVPIAPETAGVALIDQLAVIGGRLAVAAAAGLAAGDVVRRPQPESEASYQPAPTERDFALPLEWSAERALRFMRGTAHWARPYPVHVGNDRIELETALDCYHTATPEDALIRDGNEVRIRFAAGVLRARVRRC